MIHALTFEIDRTGSKMVKIRYKMALTNFYKPKWCGFIYQTMVEIRDKTRSNILIKLMMAFEINKSQLIKFYCALLRSYSVFYR